MKDQPSKFQKKFSTISFIIMLLGGVLSYFGDSMDIIKLGGYILSLLGIILLVLIWPVKSLNKFILVFTFTSLIGIFSLIPIFLTSKYFTFTDFQQSVIYPINIFILLLYGYRILYTNIILIKRVLLILALINGFIAVLGSFGIISSIPLFGEIETGRYIFGTNIPSSTGLNNNVNYYSTTQVVLLLLIILLKYISKEEYNRTDSPLLMLIFVSSFFGSSRGVLLGLFLSLLTIVIISYFYSSTLQKFKIFLGLIVLIILLVVWVTQNFQYINNFILEDLRFNRGLNGREDLWGVWVDRFKERPFLGWGSMEFKARDFINLYGVERSFQNSYLTVLYRGGLTLFICTYGLMVVCLIYNLGKVKNFFYINRYNMSIIVFFLFNAMVRNFSFGGIGLLPLSLGIVLSLCLYSNELNEKVSN
ncbi:O-antigen ligase family protein [Calidifontibacillus oryziterrae]|uniref:O-antigen ligase family protein n=1 Tax=Calidifontibacillus oryziterrae TaxID=1191699 RepID=UPI0002DACC3A|nr:O-antigen ligase family protein [Calidifontibacillus oryziterrae]